MTDDMTVEQWLAIRKEAARQIDPETAEVDWWYVQTMDPAASTPICRRSTSRYFACSPGSDVWVSFYDLPAATAEALWAKESEWNERSTRDENDLSWLVD